MPYPAFRSMELRARRRLSGQPSRGSILALAKVAMETSQNEMEAILASKKTLCIDFDGVIHSYTSGWQGVATIEDPPVEGAIGFLYDALKAFKVAIYSSRSSSSAGIDAMRQYIALHAQAAGFDYNQTQWWLQIEWPVSKPSAWVTIDDRAVTFTGEWPSIQALLNFAPWYEKPRPSTLSVAVDLLQKGEVG